MTPDHPHEAPADAGRHVIGAIVRIPRAERFELNTPGYVEDSGSTTRCVTLVNLSKSGCLIEGIEEPEVGREMSVSIRGVGRRRAFVVRLTEGGCACAFEHTLRPDELKAILDMATVGQEPEVSAAIRELRRRISEEPKHEKGMFARLGERFARRRDKG